MKKKYQTRPLFAVCCTLVLLPLGSCERRVEHKSPAMKCQTSVQALDIRDNGKGRKLVGAIPLNKITLSESLIGYGPARNPKAEITIIDGTMHLNTPQQGRAVESTTASAGQEAGFLITAQAGKWKDGGHLPDVHNLADLSTEIGRRAEQNGCQGVRVFPFKVEGFAKSLEWSASGEPQSLKGQLENVKVTIVGLYDNSGRPRNAIIKGLDIHPHVYINDKNLSGHLDKVSLQNGAKLFVPG